MTLTDDSPPTAGGKPKAGSGKNWVRSTAIGTLLLTVAVAIGFHFVSLDAVDVWWGEPTFHMALEKKVIEGIYGAVPADSSEHFITSFLPVYHLYPKQAFDLTAVAASLLLYDHAPSLLEQKEVWTGIQLTAFVLMLAALGAFGVKHYGLEAALAGIVLVATDQYFLIYSTFPRQNMGGHLLSTVFILSYFCIRSQGPSIGWRARLILGVLIGIGTLYHYSCVELGLIVIASEGVLFLLDRQLKEAALNILLIGAGALLVWGLGDLYYVSMKLLYPQAAEQATSIFHGMFHTMARVESRAMEWKIGETPWWFPLGYAYRAWNPIMSVLGIAGIGVAATRIIRSIGQPRSPKHPIDSSIRGDMMLLTGFVLLILAGMRYFAAARTLAIYTPYIALAAMLAIKSSGGVARSKALYAIGVAGIGVLALVVQWKNMENTHAAIRGHAEVNRWLEDNDIEEILMLEVTPPAPLIKAKKVSLTLAQICTQADSGILYVHRAVGVRRPHEGPAPRIFSALRKVDALASFPQYNGHPLYWYEFPLKKEIFDQTDEFLVTRKFYSMGDVKAAYCPGAD